MDLRKRLASLDRLSRRPGKATGPEPVRAADDGDALEALGLTERATPAGPVWVREYSDPTRLSGGSLPDLGGFFTRPADGASSVADLIFLDTETTGLAGGTGTIPFLVGVSWWSDGRLRTRQYFLPGPGREGALLADLESLAGDFAAVVTFNGASFDLPLLRTRARLERRRDPLADLASWDLLVPCRRLWGRRLPDCRQQTLEVEVLGRPRGGGDIDGHRIPQTWFDFLATGRPGDLPAVLTHNHRDMRGMADLLGAVLEAAGSLDAAAFPEGSGWRSAWARGRICEHRRDPASAGRWMACAVDSLADGEGTREGEETFFRDAVRILKRTADWPLVERTLEAGFARGHDAPWIHREAAILFEHRLVRFDRALHHAARSGEAGRVKRLEMKISRRYRDAHHPEEEGNDG